MAQMKKVIGILPPSRKSDRTDELVKIFQKSKTSEKAAEIPLPGTVIYFSLGGGEFLPLSSVSPEIPPLPPLHAANLSLSLFLTEVAQPTSLELCLVLLSINIASSILIICRHLC